MRNNNVFLHLWWIQPFMRSSTQIHLHPISFILGFQLWGSENKNQQTPSKCFGYRLVSAFAHNCTASAEGSTGTLRCIVALANVGLDSSHSREGLSDTSTVTGRWQRNESQASVNCNGCRYCVHWTFVPTYLDLVSVACRVHFKRSFWHKYVSFNGVHGGKSPHVWQQVSRSTGTSFPVLVSFRWWLIIQFIFSMLNIGYVLFALKMWQVARVRRPCLISPLWYC